MHTFAHTRTHTHMPKRKANEMKGTIDYSFVVIKLYLFHSRKAKQTNGNGRVVWQRGAEANIRHTVFKKQFSRVHSYYLLYLYNTFGC